MGRSLVETIMGAMVIAVAIGFAVFASSRSGVETVSGYDLIAKFDRIDGIEVGSDVRVGGIKVGSVMDVALEPDTYLARVRLSVARGIALPADSSAEIVSAGLLGDKFLAIVPGGDEERLAAGGEIRFTQSSVSLENLIGQMIYSQQGGKAEPQE